MVNVGGLNIIEGLQSPLKALGQVNQDAFSQLFARIFTNIQNSSLGENSTNTPISELLNSVEQLDKENKLLNIVLPDLSGITTKNNTNTLKDMEVWINEILSKSTEVDKADETLSQENTIFSEVFNNKSEIASDYRPSDKTTNISLNTHDAHEEETLAGYTKYNDLIRKVSEILIANNGQAVEVDNLFIAQDIPEKLEPDEKIKKPEIHENILSIIDSISTVLVQLYQKNGFSKNEEMTQQNDVHEKKLEATEVSPVCKVVQTEPELKTPDLIFKNHNTFANLADIENIGAAIVKNQDSGLMNNNTAAVKSEDYDVGMRDVQEKPINSMIFEILVNQVKDKLQAKNIDKVITVEEVLAFINEVDYKKVIGVPDTISAISINNDIINRLKNDLQKEANELFSTVVDTDMNDIPAKIEMSSNSIKANKVDMNLNIINQHTEQEILPTITANTYKASASQSNSSAVDMKHYLINAKTENLQTDNAFHSDELALDFDNEHKHKDEVSFKEILSNHANNSDVIDKSEVVIKKNENVKVFSRHENIIEAAVKGFKSLRLPEINELNVKLQPDELGEIVVKVVLEKGQINGSITAEKKDVVNILQNQVDNLKQELKNNNVNVNSISVNIGNEQQGSHQGYFNQNNKRERRNFENVFTKDLKEELDEGFDIIA